VSPTSDRGVADGGAGPAVAEPVRPSLGADQLAGFRIGVTSDRRSEDLIAALVRRGAHVVHAPALTIAPNQQDDVLVAETRALIGARPDVVLATTGYGVRRWFEVADVAGLGSELVMALEGAQVYARGPKTMGAVRAAGLNEVQVSHLDTTASLVDQVLATDDPDRTVAVQLHGFTDEEQLTRLRGAVARVLTVTPYRWAKPSGADKLPKLIEAVCQGQLDALTFTSAPAAEATLATARHLGLEQAFVDALRGEVVAAAVGPVTAGPLREAGIEPIQPERFRMGALIRLVCEFLLAERTRVVPTRRGPLLLRGRCVSTDADRVLLGPNALALFRALADAEGGVVTRTTLLGCLPRESDEHALEVSMSRLRRTLPLAGVLDTVVKRGYRLAVS
jgi:uroporphyrinogen-III synthase